MTYKAIAWHARGSADVQVQIYRDGNKVTEFDLPAVVPDGPNKGGVMIVARIKWAFENAGYKIVPGSPVVSNDEYVEYVVERVADADAKAVETITIPADVMTEIVNYAYDHDPDEPQSLETEGWFIVHDEFVTYLKYTIQRRVVISASDPRYNPDAPLYAAEYEVTPNDKAYGDYDIDEIYEPVEFVRVHRKTVETVLYV